jgi:hypothetical protein
MKQRKCSRVKPVAATATAATTVTAALSVYGAASESVGPAAEVCAIEASRDVCPPSVEPPQDVRDTEPEGQVTEPPVAADSGRVLSLSGTGISSSWATARLTGVLQLTVS